MRASAQFTSRRTHRITSSSIRSTEATSPSSTATRTAPSAPVSLMVRPCTLPGKITWGSVLTTSNRSEEHTSELQSLMRISYAVFCLKKKNKPYLPKSPDLHEHYDSHIQFN